MANVLASLIAPHSRFGCLQTLDAIKGTASLTNDEMHKAKSQFMSMMFDFQSHAVRTDSLIASRYTAAPVVIFMSMMLYQACLGLCLVADTAFN